MLFRVESWIFYVKEIFVFFAKGFFFFFFFGGVFKFVRLFLKNKNKIEMIKVIHFLW